MIKRIVQVLKIGAYFIFGFCSGFCVRQDIHLLAVSIDTIIEKSRNVLKQSGIKKTAGFFLLSFTPESSHDPRGRS